VWRKILFVSLVRDKHCFVLILYPLYLYFFVFCLFLALSVKIIHLPKLGTPVRLIWGDEAFTETNFTPCFSFHNVRYLCSNCLFINQIKFYLF